jgi:hypothetical protein
LDAPKLLTLLLLSASLAVEAQSTTALEAMKLLPKGEARKLARIEAREGTPDPERWYLLTHDEKSETGLREYVVAAGELVASRTLSQFAESVQPEEVIGGDVLKFDSDKAARLAQQYATVNEVPVATLHYQLRKAGPEAVPLWTVICVDATGFEVGRLVVSATKGNVIAHDGFAVDPPMPVAAAAPPSKPKVKRKPPTTPAVQVQPGVPVERPKPVAERPGFMDRVRGSIQKVIPGKKPEDR